MTLRRHILALAFALSLLSIPQVARAQLDALIDVVVDAVEPTPVYDTGLREATENLASKIDRLNHVLFGGSEETSASYRYLTMYSDLSDLTTAFSGFVDHSYSNAKRLEAMYNRLHGDSSLHDYASAVESTWHSYDAAVRQGGAVVARFKKLFADPVVTNSEVRTAAREAIAELEREQAATDRRVEREIETAQAAAGLLECSALLGTSPEDYVAEGKKTYGTSVSEGGSESTTGTLGTAVMIVIGLLCTVYALFAGIHLMRGSHGAETILTRLIILVVIALIIILAVQSAI